MKKIVLLMLVGVLLAPSVIFADKYNSSEIGIMSHPSRSPSSNCICLYLNENTGYLAITPIINITDLNITLTGYGMTYINTTVSLSAFQSYTDCLNFLSIGTYLLTLSTNDGVITQYEITVEPD